MRKKRLSNFDELGGHSIIKLDDSQIIYWNVHPFSEDKCECHGVDAYFKWNRDVYFIQFAPYNSAMQELGIYIRKGTISEYIAFLVVVENHISKKVFESELIKVCEQLGLEKGYRYFRKQHSLKDNYEEFNF